MCVCVCGGVRICLCVATLCVTAASQSFSLLKNVCVYRFPFPQLNSPCGLVTLRELEGALLASGKLSFATILS